MSILDKGLPVPIPCPKCGKKHQKTAEWFKGDCILACECGTRTQVTTDQQSVSTLNAVNRELKKLGDTLRNFGRRR